MHTHTYFILHLFHQKKKNKRKALIYFQSVLPIDLIQLDGSIMSLTMYGESMLYLMISLLMNIYCFLYQKLLGTARSSVVKFSIIPEYLRRFPNSHLCLHCLFQMSLLKYRSHEFNNIFITLCTMLVDEFFVSYRVSKIL